MQGYELKDITSPPIKTITDQMSAAEAMEAYQQTIQNFQSIQLLNGEVNGDARSVIDVAPAMAMATTLLVEPRHDSSLFCHRRARSRSLPKRSTRRTITAPGVANGHRRRRGKGC
jgi:hypothetical protein